MPLRLPGKTWPVTNGWHPGDSDFYGLYRVCQSVLVRPSRAYSFP
jgi:hypothetical protein